MNSPKAVQEQTKCPFCDKEGLPILPTRYAIANSARAQKSTPPALDPQFGGMVTNVAKFPATAGQYTLRLLRGGYLYTFNELRGEWAAYVVTAAGYLYQFDFNDPSPPLPEDIEFSCSREGDSVIARCITVKDAESAGKVWIGFSDVMWTDDVKKRHRKEEWRIKHMRCIDMAVWRKKDGKQDHTAPMSDAGRLVAEFTVTGPATARANAIAEAKKKGKVDPTLLNTVFVTSYPVYAFSPFRFDGNKEQLPDLVTWGEKIAKPYRPMMTALWDPVGIASELDHLMTDHYERFIASEPGRARKLAVSGAIQSIRDSIGNVAETDVMRQAKEDADNVAIYGTADPNMIAGGPMGSNGSALATGKLLAELVGGEKVRKRNKSLEDSYADVPEARLDVARKESWKKYQFRNFGRMRYDEDARAKFQADFDKKLSDFDKDTVSPLANAHKAWMTCELMRSVFESNYDDADVRSGEAYVTAVMICVGGTTDKKVCFDLYKEWLEGSATDKKNLILRALGFNQQAVLKTAEDAKEKGIDPWAMSWPSIFKAYEFANTRLGAGRAGIVSQLILALSGPFAAALSKMVDGPVRGLVVLCGMISGKAMIPVKVDGDYKIFRRTLIQKLRQGAAQAGQEVPSRKALHDPVELELRRLKARGIQVEGPTSRSFFVLIDAKHLESMPAGLTKAQRTAWLAKSLKLPSAASLTELPGAWKSVINTDVRIGAIAYVVDVVLLIHLWQGSNDAMKHKALDTWCRIGGGVVGVLGGSFEMVAKVLHARITFGAQYGRALSQVVKGIFEVVGKTLTAIGGFAMAIFDGIEAYREVKQGNIIVGGLYIVSAFAGAAMAIAVIMGWTGVGIVAAIVLLVVAGLLAWLVDNNIQDWLERCLWGSLKGEIYADEATEMAQLELALKD